MSEGIAGGLWQAFLNWIYSTGDIFVPSTYHDRCAGVSDIMSNDVSGIVKTLTGYSVNSASGINYTVECTEPTLQEALNLWLEKINLDTNIPTGLSELSKEYFKERWQGSSFCVLRIRGWEKITVNGVVLEVPTVMWYVNGASIYVNVKDTTNFVLGSEKFYLDKTMKKEIPEKNNEKIVYQKPYNRWFEPYATPYLIGNGVYKNWLAMKVLQEKSDETISKILPYLFLIKEGLVGNEPPSDDDLKIIYDNFKSQMEEYKNRKGEHPVNTIPDYRDYSHLIPDLRNIVSEELYRQGTRAMLAGLGFIDLLEISPSRQETRMNPRPFIAEVNAGVNGFKAMLMDVIALIIDRNKSKHKKLFSDNKKIEIVNSPLKINTEQILEMIRSTYDRGNLSKRTTVEVLGFDYEQEKLRRKQEAENGDEDLMYPQVINNQEDRGKDTFIPSKPKNENNEKQGKKPGTPEANNYKNAELKDVLEIAPYDKNNPPAFLKKYPKGAQEEFIEVFNKNLPKGEDYAFPVAWTALKRWMKKHGYKKVGDKWVKSEEETNG